jgi:Fe-S cluster assembly protein SufD
MPASISPIRTAAEQALVRAFESARAHLPGDIAARTAAFAPIAERGLPHRRVESWKYTDWRALLREAAPLASRPSDVAVAAAKAFASPFNGIEILFVDGHHVATAALPPGVKVTSLAAALEAGDARLAQLGQLSIAKGDPALALNAAFMSDGAVISIEAGVMLRQPLIIRSVTTGTAAQATALRSLVMLGDGATATVIESHAYLADAAHQPNTALEAKLGDGAKLTHLRFGALPAAGLGLSTLTADLGATARLVSLNTAISGAAQRHQMFIRFSGADATAQIHGITALAGMQHADHTLVVDHAATGGISRELFRTVLDGQSTGVFQGKINVQQVAQQTDGRMASNCVMLADGPVMNNKPELEIFADDVACAHGATCGALDDDLLFYLMARGIARREAENLMVESFLGEAIDMLENEALQAPVAAAVEAWLMARL